MSDHFLPADVLSVIMLCADLRTAVNISMTCRSMTLPDLSHWHDVIEIIEGLDAGAFTSTRSVLRADPPIPHGETTVVAHGSTASIHLAYDRGIMLHATTNNVTWLGSRYVDMYYGAMIGDKHGLCAIECDGDNTTVIHSCGDVTTFQSKPDNDSQLETLRWYARVVPDTLPARSAADIFRALLWPVPRWAQLRARSVDLPARSMSDQYLTNDVIGVIMLCADMRTAVSLASTCHGIKLPALSHWITVIDDVETSHDVEIISSRSVLRADPPILHGKTVVGCGRPSPAIIHYDRGIMTHAAVDCTTWLGSRYVSLQCSSAMICGDEEPCIVTYNDTIAAVHRARRGFLTFQSSPDDDSGLEILRWYARVVPDTKPAASAIDVLRSTLYPIPRWMR